MKYHLSLYSAIVILLLASFTAGQLNTTTADAKSTISVNSTITGSTASSTSTLPSSSTMPVSSITPSATGINVTTSSIAPFPHPTVQGTGWDPAGNSPPPTKESWLKEHNRFVFIIFIGLLVLGLLLWYIIKSVKGMRKRLKEENQAHLYMMQQTSGAPTNNNNGNAAAVRPSDAVNLESATPVSPPPAYKFDDHPNNSQQQQQQQQPGHSQY